MPLISSTWRNANEGIDAGRAQAEPAIGQHSRFVMAAAMRVSTRACAATEDIRLAFAASRYEAENREHVKAHHGHWRNNEKRL